MVNKASYILTSLVILVFCFLESKCQVTIRSLPDIGNRFVNVPNSSSYRESDYFIDTDLDQMFVADQREGKRPAFATCINCDEYEKKRVLQFFTLPTFDSTFFESDCSMIEGVYKRSFALIAKDKQSIPLRVSIGNDQSYVCYANVNSLKSIKTIEGRELNFVQIDTSDLLIAVINAIGAQLIKPNKYIVTRGRYLKKISDSKLLFAWDIKVPYQKNGSKSIEWGNFLVHAILDENLKFRIVRYLKLDESNLHLSKLIYNVFDSIQYTARGHTILTYNPNDLAYLEKLKKKEEEERLVPKEVTDGYEQPEFEPRVIGREKVTLIQKVICSGDSFTIHTDTIHAQYRVHNGRSFHDELYEFDYSSLEEGKPRLLKVGNILIGIYDELPQVDYQTRPSQAWKNWKFLNLPIANNDSVKYDSKSNQDFPITSLDIVLTDGIKCDTFRLKSFMPLFIVDYLFTKDGSFHVLAKSRFLESNFGSPVINYQKFPEDLNAYLKKEEVARYVPDSLVDQIISFLNYIKIPRLSELDSKKYARTNRCDVSGLKLNKNYFNAILMDRDEVLGNLEVGIYTSDELRSRKPKGSLKKGKEVYILIYGYVFKFDYRSKSLWLGDGTELKAVENLRAAVDIAIRSVLCLNYNVELERPICYE